MTDEDVIKLNLSRERRDYEEKMLKEQTEREFEETKPKKMPTVILFSALFLSMIQIGIEGLTLGTLGWIISAPINGGLYLVLRPYSKYLKTFKWLPGASMVISSLPLIGLIPADILAIFFVYFMSRSALASHLAQAAEKTHLGTNKLTAQP
ncbi:MAG: hypothetical protein UX77_C0010G0029 [Parcubacteria group bacterium GW2011_GWA1_47_11]|uniref:Uncharacterized protein n=1 Tax=Candidatus Yanofskybacteria bacterium RIFCSPHIGHO2_01_FULL_48_25b TaxID=1802672 RepID=A0A1F8EZY1_9BACT|nr:MAG: hypothetical protein UX77_C0010G0029 [Parcubacteria group bacterium GW2011_GWA1_47_11]OGN06434.1 MAG: hypothetical protein A2669_01565 [Candidatus Yanofskybacteria bacterium RIFCSPHIGHO2_01_FULL_48_25b]